MAGGPDPLITHDLTVYCVHDERDVYATVTVGFASRPSDAEMQRVIRGARELFTNAFHVKPSENPRYDLRELESPVPASEHDTTPIQMDPAEAPLPPGPGEGA